jgi:hypothetical protein
MNRYNGYPIIEESVVSRDGLASELPICVMAATESEDNLFSVTVAPVPTQVLLRSDCCNVHLPDDLFITAVASVGSGVPNTL